ncbi:MAG: hypothetical protein K5673_07275 [Lachnospiraceae bacterium]|nr:hypothetical protein [Lachnospiraceae bacterium]
MFDITTDNVRTASRFLFEGSLQLNRLAYDIGEVMELLEGMSGMDDVILTLKYLQNDVRTESKQEGILFDTSTKITAEYDETEEEILMNMDNSKFEMQIPQYRIASFSTGSGNHNSRIDMRTMNELLEQFV